MRGDTAREFAFESHEPVAVPYAARHAPNRSLRAGPIFPSIHPVCARDNTSRVQRFPVNDR
ncbi:hypothetical protein GCM10017612_13180 [Novosphingobium resinovorum]|nr:hypothetical protein GCM10017612_13180 [Novosphingobium resinovorum]